MGDVNAPPPRDYGQETRDTLQAQVDLAPDRYAAESKFSPLYTDLSVQNLRRFLLGNGDSQGFLSTFEEIAPRTQAIQDQTQNAQRASDLAALQQFGPDTVKAIRNADPQQAALMSKLNESAMADLNAGTNLTPDQLDSVRQSVRAAQAGRGVGWGNADATAEAFAAGDRGLALQQVRQRTAQDTARLNAATGADPALVVLGRSSQGAAQGQALLGQGQQGVAGAGPSLFNPESGYAGDVYNTNFNSQAAANIASANNKSALIGAGISAAGSVGSSM